MLDIDKIEVEATILIRSFTREQLLEWVEFDKKRMALARKEERLARKAATTGMDIGKINGKPIEKANSRGTSTKKPVRTTRIRSKAKATADSL